MAAKRHLGRGLSALLGDDAPASPTPAPAIGQRMIGTDKLRPGRFQPRENFDAERLEQLAQSVREKGVLQPILARRVKESDELEIVAGERRWRAAQLAGQHEVPVIVRELDDKDALEIALVENIQRQDLNPIEEGLAYRRLLQEFDYTQEELAGHVGKSRPHIANTMRLLELPPAVRQLLIGGALSAGQARPLIGHPQAEALARKIAKDGLSARAAEALARKSDLTRPKSAKTPSLATKKKDADTRALENDLTLKLGLKVEITFDGKGGNLTIEYKTLDQLDDLIRKLSA